jgi:hypothetical protein
MKYEEEKIIFLKMEDNLNFFQMEDDLKFVLGNLSG